MLMGRCCLCSVLCDQKWFPSGHESTAFEINGSGFLPIPLPEQYPDSTEAIDFFSLRHLPDAASLDTPVFGSPYPLSGGGGVYNLPTDAHVGISNLSFDLADTFVSQDFFSDHIIQPDPGIDFSPVSLPLDWSESVLVPSCLRSRSQTVNLPGQLDYGTELPGAKTFEFTIDNWLCSKADGATYNNYAFDAFDTFDTVTDPGNVIVSNSTLDAGVDFEDLLHWSDFSPVDLEYLVRDAWYRMMFGSSFAYSAQNPQAPCGYAENIKILSLAKVEFEAEFDNGTVEVDYNAWQTWAATTRHARLSEADAVVTGSPVAVPGISFPIANPVVYGQKLTMSAATFAASGGAAYFGTQYAALDFPGVNTAATGLPASHFVNALATVTVTATFESGGDSVSTDNGPLGNHFAQGHATADQTQSYYSARGQVVGASTQWRSSAAGDVASLDLNVTAGDISRYQALSQYFPGTPDVIAAPSNTVGLARETV